MKSINVLRKLLKLPFVIVMSPIVLAGVFLMTDLEDERERAYSKRFLSGWIW